MTQTKIRTEPFLDEQALRVVLNAPKANVLDSVMMAELNQLLDSLEKRKELKLLCFMGEGDHFCFGASVPEHTAEKAPEMLRGFHGLFLRLADLCLPTVAAVRGQCLGGGMELASFCNFVVAHPQAKLGQPEIQLGVLPPIASLILPFKIGQARADDINLTGRTLTAAQAKEYGLVDRIVDDPVRDVEQWAAREIAPKSASSLRLRSLMSMPIPICEPSERRTFDQVVSRSRPSRVRILKSRKPGAACRMYSRTSAR